MDSFGRSTIALGFARRSAVRARELARAGADPALPVECDGSRSGADRAFLNRTFARRFDGGDRIGGFHTPRANVIQEAVVGFADHGIDRAHFSVAGLLQRP